MNPAGAPLASAGAFAGNERSTVVRLRHVFKVYRIADTGVVALGGADLDIDEGEFLAVVGPSGAGKSTILNLVGGLDRASAGTVEVEGRDLGLLDDDERTRYRAETDRVRLAGSGTQPHPLPHRAGQRPAPGGRPRSWGAAASIRRPPGSRRPHGPRAPPPGHALRREQQRAAIAIALANTPRILLADEPTAELDSDSSTTVLDAFRAVNQEFGVTIVMVTHDLVAARRADRRVRVHDGRLQKEGIPLDPVDEEGRVRLPEEALPWLADADLEAEVHPDEVRLRRREGGLGDA